MLNRLRRDDEGFGLMEVVVAMLVFSIMVTAALGILLKTLGVAKDNGRRTAAANLATKQIEAARSQLAVDVPDGATIRTEQVGATTYRIEQNANYVTSGSGTSLCANSTGELAYKLVTATITWPDMGSIKPVRADTLLALGLGAEGLSETAGTMAVGVEGATGQPMAGITVTLNPGGYTRLTGVDGCAVFVNLPAPAAGTDYTATVGQPGYVSPTNTRAAAVTAGVKPGQIQRGGKLRYDEKRSLTVTYDAPSGYTAPSDLRIGVRSSDIDTGTLLASCGSVPTGDGCISAAPGVATNLFPAIYDVWAGSCPSPRPDGSYNNVDLATGDRTVSVPLQGIRTQVLKNADGTPLTGYTVTVTGACGGGAPLTLPPTSSGASLGALPAGDWTVEVSGPDGTQTRTVTLSPGDAPLTVEFWAKK